jgi:tetratricopeptide (TPR) repeat protein
METLKMSFPGKLFIIILFSGFVSTGIAQNQKPLEDAFTSSYTLEQKADYSAAISALKAVYDEKSYDLNLRLGWLNYLSGMFTESSAYYQKAMKLMPYAIEPKLGYVYPASAMGNWDQVIIQYQEILKIDPLHSIVNYRLGCIYYGRGDYNLADKYLEKVVNLYPFDYDSNIMYAWTSYKLGKFREAQVLFHKVLRIKPNDSSAMEGLGLIK